MCPRWGFFKPPGRGGLGYGQHLQARKHLVSPLPPRRETLSKTHQFLKKIAELALADITVKLEKKEIGFDLPAPAPAKLPKGIEDFLTEYEAYSKTNHRKATVRRYKAIIDNFKAFLKTRPGVLNLGHLSPKLFEDYKTYKRDVPVSPNGRWSKQRPDSRRKGAKANTINMEVETLRTVFGLAVKWGELSKNPVEGVKALKVDDAKAPRFLTHEEARKLLAEAAKVSPQLHDIFFTLVYTSMRKGELQHLTWDDVDLERRVIKVQNKPDWTPKAGQREISMHKAVRELLLCLKEQNTANSQFVFHECDGGPLKLKLRRALITTTQLTHRNRAGLNT